MAGQGTSSNNNSAGNNDIVEREVEVTIRHSIGVPTGVTFVHGRVPPRVDRVLHRSWFSGCLYAGDVILQIDGRNVNNAEEFYSIVDSPSNKQKRVRIRLLRDEFYRIREHRLQTILNEAEVIDVEIQWRSGGMPLGVIMDNELMPGKDKSGKENRRILVSEIEPGSIGKQSFRYGDIITHVNAKPVSDVSDARNNILESINRSNAVVVRILRPLRLPEGGPIPDDVKMILRKHRDFFRYKHSHAPALKTANKESSPHISYTTQQGTTRTERTTRSPRSTSPGHVSIQPPTRNDVRQIPQDGKTKPVETPKRKGSYMEK